MDLNVLDLIMPLVMLGVSTLVSIVVFMMKKVIERVQKLEDQAGKTANRQEVRSMIDDKLSPLHKQMARIDHKIDKLYELIYQHIIKK